MFANLKTKNPKSANVLLQFERLPTTLSHKDAKNTKKHKE